MKFQLSSFFLLCLFLSSYTATGQNLQQIESIEYDHANHRFFISNSNSIIARAADGSLNTFGSGAASYGMEVMNNTLFVIQGSGVQGYDLDTEQQVMSVNIPQAGFLNGLAADGQNNLYATDFGNNRIYKIDVSDYDNPVLTTLLSNTSRTPNGITYDAANDRLVFVSWGTNATINAVDLSNNERTTLVTTSLGNIDGIDIDPNGDFYVASWTPTRITKYKGDFSGNPETITAPGLNRPADICYANEIDTLAIPNSGNATLTFVGFESTTSTIDFSANSFNFQVAPNPLQPSSVIRYELAKASKVQIELLDVQGRRLSMILDQQQGSGEHQVLLAGLDIPAGTYFCRLIIDGQQLTKPVQAQGFK